MACQTCDHTMQRVNDGTPHVFWCPRCGTLKFESMVSPEQFEEPKLVQRAFTLCEAALFFAAEDETSEAAALEQAELAVRECCLPPSER